MHSERRAVKSSRVLVMFLLASGVALQTLSQPHDRTRAVRPPAAHSSEERINAALAAGQIDSETALTFKVFAVFGDCRLPRQYLGDAGDLPDSDIMSVVQTRFASLSPATQAVLQPFLLAPGVQGSWAELPTNCVNQNSGGFATSDLPKVEWVVLETRHKATVRYEKRFPSDAVRAEVVAETVDAVWFDLTNFFGREPKGDSGAAFGDGGDSRLDIYLLPFEIDRDGEHVWGVWEWSGCSDSPGYIAFNTSPSKSVALDRETLVHELTHAIISSYKTDLCGDYRWLNEATATWAQHFIFPEEFNRLGAAAFLNDPSRPLETFEEGGLHQYGAYLFLFFLQHGLGQPQLVRAIWDRSPSEPNSLVNIDSVLSPAGGLKEVWPQFVRYNWNQKPVDDYHRWDPLPSPFALTAADTRGQRIISDLKTTETTLSRVSPLRHLSAQYVRLQLFEAAAKSVLFLNGWTFEADKNLVPVAQTEALAYTSIPSQQPKDTIRVETLAKLNGQWEKYVGSSDWTQTPFKAWCRDLTSERLEELVVIVSNSEFRDRNSTYGPAKLPLMLFESNMACSEWKGSAKMVWSWTTGDAAMTQSSDDIKWKRTTAEVGQVPFKNGFAPTGWSFVAEGTINWKAQGTYPVRPDRCTLSGSGSFDASNVSLLSTFNFLPSGSDLSFRYLGFGSGASLPTFNVSCPRIPVTTSTLGPWFVAVTDSGDFPKVSNDGKTLKGMRDFGGQLERFSYSWNFVALPPQ